MTETSPRLRSTAWAVAAVLLAVVSVQFGAAFAKNLFTQAGPQGVTAMRTLFAALVLGGIWRPWRGGLPTAAGWRVVLAYGASLGFMNLLFYLALQRLPLGIAVAIEFVGPFAVAVAFSRRVIDLVWVVLAIAGLGGLLPVGLLSAELDKVGVLYALGAGLCWAFYIIFGQKAGRLLSGGRAAALGMAIAAVATVPFGIVSAGPALLDPAVVLPGLAVALLSSAIPFPLEMAALRRLPARTFGILLSLEPVVAALSGMLLLGEDLTLGQWIAIGGVVAASLGSTVTSRGR